MAFYTGGSNYPASYNNALFFADYSRQCMWVMFPGADGNPDPATRAPFASSAQFPVDLQIGPDGNLYYVDIAGGRIIRVEYGPVAVASGTPLFGLTPLTVDFSSAGSAPAQTGDTITYAWDLDGDGQFDDSTLTNPSFTYTNPGTYNVRLKVTDNNNVFNVSDVLTVTAGNEPPTATINSPNATFTWRPDQSINFTGGATDPQDGNLPESALSWTVLIHHCPAGCHTHPYQTFEGVDHGTFDAPDHEYPAFLELRLTATDSGGLENTVSVQLQPKTVNLTFQSVPSGLQLSVGTFTGTTPFTRQVIQDSNLGIEAPSPQGPNVFSSWSDGGAQEHLILANNSQTYTATFLTLTPTPTATPDAHATRRRRRRGPTATPTPRGRRRRRVTLTPTPHAPTNTARRRATPTRTRTPTPTRATSRARRRATPHADADRTSTRTPTPTRTRRRRRRRGSDADADAHADARSQHVPPTVALTSPVGRLAVHGAGFDRPGRERLGLGRLVSRVDFYDGSTLLGSDTTAAVRLHWTDAPAGRAHPDGRGRRQSARLDDLRADPGHGPGVRRLVASGRRRRRRRRQRELLGRGVHGPGLGREHQRRERRVPLRVRAGDRQRHGRGARRLDPEHQPGGQGRGHDPREPRGQLPLRRDAF